MLQLLSFEQYFSSPSFYLYSFLFLCALSLYVFSHFFLILLPSISFTVPLFLLRAHTLVFTAQAVGMSVAL